MFGKRGERVPAQGLSVVELVVAVAVAVTIAVGVFAVARFSLLATRASTLTRRAVLIAEEGMAIARYERDASWTAFAAKPTGTTLYPTFSGGQAQLSTVDPGPVDGIFTSRVTLSPVFRDALGNIAASGTLDGDARRVRVEVSWIDPFGRGRTITLESYLMKSS